MALEWQEADKLKIERFRYWAKFPEKLRKLTGLMEKSKKQKQLCQP